MSRWDADLKEFGFADKNLCELSLVEGLRIYIISDTILLFGLLWLSAATFFTSLLDG